MVIIASIVKYVERGIAEKVVRNSAGIVYA